MTTRLRKYREAKFRLSDGIPCHYCGITLSIDTSTAEHVVPRSKGGKDVSSNLRVACKPCNSARGTHDYDAFKAFMLPVKQARLAGREPPVVGKFSPPGKEMPRKLRQEDIGYTAALLSFCVRVSRFAEAQTNGAAAVHFGLRRRTVCAIREVMKARPGRRISVAEDRRLLELVAADEKAKRPALRKQKDLP